MMRGPTVTDMVERVAAALLESWGNGELCAEGNPCCDPLRDDARRAIDALMPVVDTAAELDALPLGSKLLDANGTVWVHTGVQGRWLPAGWVPRGVPSSDVLTEAPPVRVIWMPEADHVA